MAENVEKRYIVIYTTRGEVGGFLLYPHIYNRQGEWIGWVTAHRQVYSVHGHYVGYLTDEPRILRKQSSGYLKPMRTPPSKPRPINPPATIPLPPLMPEIPIGSFDVIDDHPDLMPSLDFGDLRDDLD